MLKELGYTKTLTGVGFEDAITRATEVLASQGFGIISDVDVQAKMKAKLDADMRPYRILGACNPGFAYKALERDPEIGLLLPCNVIVYQNEDASVTVSFASPPVLFKLVEDPALGPLMDDVDTAIRKAFEAL